MRLVIFIYIHNAGNAVFSIQAGSAILHADICGSIFTVRTGRTRQADMAFRPPFPVFGIDGHAILAAGPGLSVCAVLAHYQGISGHILIQHHDQFAGIIHAGLDIFRTVLIVRLGSFTFNGQGVAQFLLDFPAVAFQDVSCPGAVDQVFNLAVVHRIGIHGAGLYIRNLISACVDAVLIDDHVAIIRRNGQRCRFNAVQVFKILRQLHVQHAVAGNDADIVVCQGRCIRAAFDIQLLVQMLGNYVAAVPAEFHAIVKGRYLMLYAVSILIHDTGNAVLAVQAGFANLCGNIGFRILAVRTGRPDEANLTRRTGFALFAFFAYNQTVSFQVLVQHNDHVAVRIHLCAHVLRAVLDGCAVAARSQSFAFNRYSLAQLLRRRGSFVACKGQVTAIYLSADFLQLAVVHRIRVVRAGRHICNLVAARVDAILVDDHIAIICGNSQCCSAYAVQPFDILRQLHVQHAVFGDDANIVIAQRAFRAALDIQLLVQMLGNYVAAVPAEFHAVVKGRYLMLDSLGILVHDTGDAVRTVQSGFADFRGDIGFRILAVLALRPDETNLTRRTGFALIAFFAYDQTVSFQVLVQHDDHVAVIIHLGAHILRAVLDSLAVAAGRQAFAFNRNRIAGYFLHLTLVSGKEQSFRLAGRRINDLCQIVHGSQAFHLYAAERILVVGVAYRQGQGVIRIFPYEVRVRQVVPGAQQPQILAGRCSASAAAAIASDIFQVYRVGLPVIPGKDNLGTA